MVPAGPDWDAEHPAPWLALAPGLWSHTETLPPDAYIEYGLRSDPDDEDRIRRCVIDALAGGCVVACGGTGDGLTDLTFAAFRPGGMRFLAESVALAPGSTAAVAAARSGACLFMPGDPESIVALTHALLRPALARRLEVKMGSWEEAPLLPLLGSWSGPGDVHAFVPAAIRESAIEVVDRGGAGGLLHGGGYALMPPGGRDRRRAVPVPP